MTRLVWLACFALLGQTPDTVKVDTPQVRAVLVTAQPGRSRIVPEPDLDHVLVFTSEGTIAFTTMAGAVEKISFQAGQSHWMPANGTRSLENIGFAPVPLVEIALKQKPQPFTPSEIDPLKTAPKYYSRELETEHVRVLRVRMGPHEKGPRHDHQLNHIVIYLTDHAKGPAGTVKIEGPDVHSEENPLDHPVERIAVDIK